MEGGQKVPIAKLHTGVPGLDVVLQGGLPEYSFNLIAGAPGTGKTTLAHQIMFANASPERPALYFTVLGEPAVKMLRYQQQMSFFVLEKIGTSVHFINLSGEVLSGDLKKVVDRVIQDVERIGPAIVVIDSFRTIAEAVQQNNTGNIGLQSFVQQLALFLMGYGATSFLVGEYSEDEAQNNSIFTVADGIFWLSQTVDSSSVVRKLQVIKMRGEATTPGRHTFRITDDGIQVFPHLQAPSPRVLRLEPRRRLATGVTGLDAMLGGGIPEGDAVLVAGPVGSGKTLLGMEFIYEGLKGGEPGVVAILDERPEEYISRAKSLGFDLEGMIWQNQLKVLDLRPLEIPVDESFHEVWEAATSVGAKRVVIDSVSGIDLALAPSFRENLRESLYRLVDAMTGSGITLMLTIQAGEMLGELKLSPQSILSLADDIIFMRHVEIERALRKALGIIKMRSSSFDERMRCFTVTPAGLQVGDPLPSEN